MHKGGKIIASLVIFVALLSLPFFYNIGKSNKGPVINLNTPAIQQLAVKECVEPTAWMRANHMKLLEILSNYQGIRKCQIIAVFDAYRVQGHFEEVIDDHNIHMVYTREAQTADQYIEKFAHDNQKKYNITVATSDGLQQLIIRGAGCALLSARELKVEIDGANERLRQDYQERQGINRNYLVDALSPTTKRQMEEVVKKDI